MNGPHFASPQQTAAARGSTESATVLGWLKSYRNAIDCWVERIAFTDSREWRFSGDRSHLGHQSGRFYTIRGYVAEHAGDSVAYQPLIDQPEIGTQGFVVRRNGGQYDLLLQARTEPGNVGLVQLGPTIQATFSNYTAVHKGKRIPFLNRFHEPHRFNAKVIVDTVQPELGSKFLKKWNRNIVLECTDLDDFSHPMFCWASLSSLAKLMHEDNVVNNDARLVIGQLMLTRGGDLFADACTQQGAAVSRSFGESCGESFEDSSLAAEWIKSIRTREALRIAEVSLAELPGWEVTDNEIRHSAGLHFSVVHQRVHASDREVTDWDQPLIACNQKGKVTLVCQEVEGVMNFLFHAEAQVGNARGAQLQPTWCDDNEGCIDIPNNIALLLRDDILQKRFTFEGSEEGGRFFQYINQFDIRWVRSDASIELPETYRWLTLRQVVELMNKPAADFISDESRSVLSLFLAAAWQAERTAAPTAVTTAQA